MLTKSQRITAATCLLFVGGIAAIPQASAESPCKIVAVGGLNSSKVKVECKEQGKTSSPGESGDRPVKSPFQLELEACRADAARELAETGVEHFCTYVVGDSEAAAVNVAAVSREAALSLKVPSPELTLGPDPAENKWNMIPVNFPLWFQSSTPATMTRTITTEGITISLTAVRDHVTVTTGDGTTLTCRALPQRPDYTTDLPRSPGCGHTYRSNNHYTITATSTWTVSWSAVGQTGTVTTTSASSRTLDVGELSAVLVRPPA